jgi:putative CocE/NonD family hydrolase
MNRRPLSIIALSLSLAFAAGAHAATTVETVAADAPVVQRDLRASYTKYEYRIPMRDGAKLFTVVYVPKDASKSYPFLLNRTPYSSGVYADGELRYGEDWFPNAIGPSKEFEDAGYIFVKQDVRGRYMSEGKWQEMTPHAKAQRAAGEGQESQDMYDTMEWLLKHVPNNNGKAGIYGISYPGFYTAASIIDSHPSIKAASPQAPVTDLFMGDDSYHGGAFMLAANFGFYANFVEQKNPTTAAEDPRQLRLRRRRRLRLLPEAPDHAEHPGTLTDGSAPTWRRPSSTTPTTSSGRPATSRAT